MDSRYRNGDWQEPQTLNNAYAIGMARNFRFTGTQTGTNLGTGDSFGAVVDNAGLNNLAVTPGLPSCLPQDFPGIPNNLLGTQNLNGGAPTLPAKPTAKPAKPPVAAWPFFS